MYEPKNNRRAGITKNIILDNIMHYVQVEYEQNIPRVIMIWSKSKYGASYPEMVRRIGMYMTEKIQVYESPYEALKEIASQVPRRTNGEPTTIDGLIADQLIEDPYFGLYDETN